MYKEPTFDIIEYNDLPYASMGMSFPDCKTAANFCAEKLIGSKYVNKEHYPHLAIAFTALNGDNEIYRTHPFHLCSIKSLFQELTNNTQNKNVTKYVITVTDFMGKDMEILPTTVYEIQFHYQSYWSGENFDPNDLQAEFQEAQRAWDLRRQTLNAKIVSREFSNKFSDELLFFFVMILTVLYKCYF